MTSYGLLIGLFLAFLSLTNSSAFCSEDTSDPVPNYKEVGCYLIKCSDWSNLKRFHKVFVVLKTFNNLRKAVDSCAVQAVKLKYKMFGVRLVKNYVECWKEEVQGFNELRKAAKPKGRCKLGVGRGKGMMAYTVIVKETSCGKSTFGSHRIIGGEKAAAGDWPWQVGVYYDGEFVCGGVIIKQTAVLTAAHCLNLHNMNKQLDTKSAHRYRVRVGDFDLEEDELTQEDYEVSALIMHRDWHYPIPDNDIGMLRLRKPIKFSSTVGPACLPQANEPSILGKTCYISGWGKTDVTVPYASQYLQQAKLPPVNLDECREKKKDSTFPWLKMVNITDNMVCGGIEGSVMSMCHGDSGGPYVCQNNAGHWVLQGIASWMSPDCDSTESFSVFTRVSKYYQWIYLNSILRI